MVLCVLCGYVVSLQAQTDNASHVHWEPAEIVNGAPILFRVTAPNGVTAVQGTWDERTIDFRFSRKCNCWYAMAGIDLDAKPGPYKLILKASGKSGEPMVVNQEVPVALKTYPSTAITVAPRFIHPPPAAQKRIEEEQALKKKLFAEIRPETLWSGRFQPPVATETTGGFGSARVLNGVKQSAHMGLDYHAPVGTTVRASNRGVVLLARNLYGEGNCVVIDHGQGLATVYMHLSKISVQEGASVSTGQVVGLSGNTGRSTGPHLHFGVRWQGLYMDPATLLNLAPPE